MSDPDWQNQRAFPTVSYEKPGDYMGTSIMTIGGGLSKREIFAMAAMQGMLAHDYDSSAATVARNSIECAEALLAELAKEPA